MSEDDPDNQLVRVDHGALALTILADNRILSEMVGASLLLAKESTLAPPKSNSFRRHFLLHQIPPERVKEILEKFPAKPPTPAAPAADGQSIGNPDIDAIIQEASEREYLREAKGLYRSKGDGMTVENIRAFGLFLRVAEAGHSEAQCYLGECYRYGDGVGQDHVEAVKWYREAAGQGNALAQISLYYCYPYGDGVPDFAERFKSIRKAAKQGDAVAQTQLGVCYHCGLGVRQDHAEAVKWYRKAAEQGDIDGQTQLGRCYRYGHGVPKDYEESAKWYRKAAEQAYNAQPQPSRTTDTFKRVEPIPPSRPTDLDSLAREFESLVREGEGLLGSKGDGMTEENIRAFGLFLRAAEAGHRGAQYILAFRCYLIGDGVPKDYEESAKWYRKAAKNGHAHAQHMLGTYYLHGVSVPQDYEEAAKWFRKAAEGAGEDWVSLPGEPMTFGVRAMAQYELGNCFRDGQGVPQDMLEAYKWYQLAAERGHAKAQCNLGTCYYDGEGVAKDRAEAVKWYREAAEQGDAVAQNYLGECYRHGDGVAKDYVEAVKWYWLAADQGDEKAKARVAMFAAPFMSASELEAAQRLYREFKNKQPARK